eukprot:TRINITY_DN63045_c0_g1_i1.p1 TRINITY_DN63045_c0_g1~~TRINITY_DN63045_c0_g1_i1.p1  ORF type:complete len:658 (+),score=98.94 TRINITY_DN63045_c0_g1_i1:236-1975(+)
MWWDTLRQLAEADHGCGAAIACLIGLAIGDSVGAPLEFCDVDPRPPDTPQGAYLDTERPCLLFQLKADSSKRKQLSYRGRVCNKFGLYFGQWTDDTSMALCLADSLLVHNRYHGGDARVRWHMWWNHGYCNAFRYSGSEQRRGSVGLGGNVSKSLGEVERSVIRAAGSGQLTRGMAHASVVSPVYQSCSNDAGNGSIMRLAPVPIAYHLCPQQALEVAAWQSLATHPGGDAALCCRFMTFLCVAAIGVHRDAARSRDAELHVSPITDLKTFLEEQIDAFLHRSAHMALPPGVDDDGVSADRLRRLLLSQPPSRKEAHWNWKVPHLAINEAIQAREGPHGRDLYNGHPTIPTYFGAYCMDGLAMALWSLWNSNSFSSCIQKAVNLLGDADTVGAIAGQMAGAFYGWRGIDCDEWSKRCLRNLKHWDLNAEIGLRAALLYHHGPRPQACLRQSEGHPAVRVFRRPMPGDEIVGEVPSGEFATCTDINGDFYEISYGDGRVKGWVGRKNIASWATAAGTEDLKAYTPPPAPPKIDYRSKGSCITGDLNKPPPSRPVPETKGTSLPAFGSCVGSLPKGSLPPL